MAVLRRHLFIKFIIAEEMEAAPDAYRFSGNQWKHEVRKPRREYFEDQEINRMVLFHSLNFSYEKKVSEVMVKVHMEHFGGEKVPMPLEPQERGRCFLPL